MKGAELQSPGIGKSANIYYWETTLPLEVPAAMAHRLSPPSPQAAVFVEQFLAACGYAYQ